jgi:hypothetical protein
MWLCKCSCGKETYARTHDLKKGKKKSCGHLRVEHNKKFAEYNISFRKRSRQESVGSGPAPNGWGVDDLLDELKG